jgi:hypothetical protein
VRGLRIVPVAAVLCCSLGMIYWKIEFDVAHVVFQ